MALSVAGPAGVGTTSAVATLVTPSFLLTAGDLVVVLLATQSTDTITAGNFTDTAGDTFHQAGSTLTTGSNHYSLWYAYNTTMTVSDQVTLTFPISSGAYDNLVAYTVHSTVGSFTSDPFDSTASNTGNSASLSSGTLTVTGTQDAIFAVCEADNKGLVAGTGYTLTLDASWGLDSFEAFEYHVVTANESATASCTSGPWNINAAAFKEPTAAVVVTPSSWLPGQQVVRGKSWLAVPSGWTPNDR